VTPTHRADGAAADGATSAADGAFDDFMDRMAAEQAAAAPPEPETVEEDPRDDRPDPPLLGGEMETLGGFLDFLRATVHHKCAGLTDEQAAESPLGSLTSPIGLVRHLADVERYWFGAVIGAVPSEEVGYRWSTGPGAGEDGAEFRLEGGASLAEALEDYAAACASSRAILAGREGDDEARGARERRSVRWVLIHMVEETGRHLGHLDAVTELIDGRTGE